MAATPCRRRFHWWRPSHSPAWCPAARPWPGYPAQAAIRLTGWGDPGLLLGILGLLRAARQLLTSTAWRQPSPMAICLGSLRCCSACWCSWVPWSSPPGFRSMCGGCRNPMSGRQAGGAFRSMCGGCRMLEGPTPTLIHVAAMLPPWWSRGASWWPGWSSSTASSLRCNSSSPASLPHLRPGGIHCPHLDGPQEGPGRQHRLPAGLHDAGHGRRHHPRTWRLLVSPPQGGSPVS